MVKTTAPKTQKAPYVEMVTKACESFNGKFASRQQIKKFLNESFGVVETPLMKVALKKALAKFERKKDSYRVSKEMKAAGAALVKKAANKEKLAAKKVVLKEKKAVNKAKLVLKKAAKKEQLASKKAKLVAKKTAAKEKLAAKKAAKKASKKKPAKKAKKPATKAKKLKKVAPKKTKKKAVKKAAKKPAKQAAPKKK